MVVFTCQKCNNTLKKKAVEKHNSCRPFFLTCVDCLKDFKGNEYDEHKSCITEAQKYGGRNVVVKPQGVKQGKWNDLATEVLKNLMDDNRYTKICLATKGCTNIPRNKTKFHNFIKNRCPKWYNSGTVDEIFSKLEEAKGNNSPGNSETINEVNTSQNSEVNNEEKQEVNEPICNELNTKKKTKKNKGLDEGKVNSNGDVDNSDNVVKDEEKSDLNESMSGNNKAENKRKRSSPQSKIETIDDDNMDDKAKKRKEEKKLRRLLQATLDEKDRNNLGNWFNISKDDKTIDAQNHEVVEKDSDKQDNLGNKITNGKTEINTSEDCNGINHTLSKKERKKLKKQKKYNAEIAEIENIQPEKETDNNLEEEKVHKKKKKKRDNMEVENEPSEVALPLSPKRKLDEGGVEDVIQGKKIKLNDTLTEDIVQNEQGKKFKWSNVIKQILEASENNEMSLKKLRKKVINAYNEQKGGDITYEKLLAIFNKKINSTIGIRVVKDRAHLVPQV